MSKAYDNYLKEHIGNVNKGYKWLLKHALTGELPTVKGMKEQILAHDKSKYEEQEYGAYDAYFYGGNDKNNSIVNSAFDYAWLYHQHRNPHHWQYWVLIKDVGDVVPLEMPLEFVVEMVLDWWAFSWGKGNLYEVFEWYEANKRNMQLHHKTRNVVESILFDIRKALEEAGVEVEG